MAHAATRLRLWRQYLGAARAQPAPAEAERSQGAPQREPVLVALQTLLALADAPALAGLLRERPALVTALADVAGCGEGASWAANACLLSLLSACGAQVRGRSPGMRGLVLVAVGVTERVLCCVPLRIASGSNSRSSCWRAACAARACGRAQCQHGSLRCATLYAGLAGDLAERRRCLWASMPRKPQRKAAPTSCRGGWAE